MKTTKRPATNIESFIWSRQTPRAFYFKPFHGANQKRRESCTRCTRRGLRKQRAGRDSKQLAGALVAFFCFDTFHAPDAELLFQIMSAATVEPKMNKSPRGKAVEGVGKRMREWSRSGRSQTE